MTLFRIIIALFGFASAFLGYWWIALIAILVLSLRFRAWEVILIGLLDDFMWVPSSVHGSAIPYMTLAAIAIVWIFEPMRREFLAP